MKILAEINTQTHTVIENTVLKQILDKLQAIESKVGKHQVERVSVSLREASKMLGCSYGYAKVLFHSGKLKGRQDDKGTIVLIEYQSVIDFVKKAPSQQANGEYIEDTCSQQFVEPLSDSAMIELQRKLMKKRA